MSGPPTSSYNGGTSLQTDDRRGCRCLYGPAAGQPEGYSCSLPEKLELGGASVGDASLPAPGGASYYLVRGAGPPAHCNAALSFSTGAPQEKPGTGGDRDTDLALDPEACP